MINLGAGFRPSYDGLLKLSRKANIIPVYREIVADCETPVSCFAKIVGGSEYAALLESVEGGERWGRYSFIVGRPAGVIISDGKSAAPDILERVKEFMSGARPAHLDGLPRFWGGAVGYCAYDIVRRFEKLPARPDDDLKLPESVFLMTDEIIVFDHLFHTIKVVVCADLRKRRLTPGLYREICGRIDGTVKKITAGARLSRRHGRRSSAFAASGKISSNFSRAEFLGAVREAKKYIRAGDVIQVVLSQRFERTAVVRPFDIYRALRIINPSPYMYFFRLGDFHIIGSSPEILVRKEGGAAITKPIAGTRRRGRDSAEDARLAAELKADPKERAEHIMLVDLGRNDLSRVCRLGSVRVSELMQVEKYSHVMHMVSTVSGNLRSGADAFDLFRACFPAGTVTGAPKVRAMQIIDELEPVARGPYAGAVGYFSYDGNMDTAITIRTIVQKDSRSYVQAGAGIVADSVPAKEYRETQNKARALFRALDLASLL